MSNKQKSLPKEIIEEIVTDLKKPTNKQVIQCNSTEMLQQIAYSLKVEPINKTDLDQYIVKVFGKCCDEINKYMNRGCTPINELYKHFENTCKNTENRIKNGLSWYYNIEYMEQLIGMNTLNLLKIPNLGYKCIKFLQDAWIKAGHKIILTNKHDIVCGEIYEFEW